MSLLNIPKEPQKRQIKISMRESVVEDFERFVAFAQTEEPHATADNVLEYLLDEFFGETRRQEMRDIEAWRERKDEEAVGTEGDEEIDGEEIATPGETDKDQVRAGEESAAADEEAEEAEEVSVEKTGELRVPRPKEKMTTTRRIERSGEYKSST